MFNLFKGAGQTRLAAGHPCLAPPPEEAKRDRFGGPQTGVEVHVEESCDAALLHVDGCVCELSLRDACTDGAAPPRRPTACRDIHCARALANCLCYPTPARCPLPTASSGRLRPLHSTPPSKLSVALTTPPTSKLSVLCSPHDTAHTRRQPGHSTRCRCEPTARSKQHTEQPPSMAGSG